MSRKGHPKHIPQRMCVVCRANNAKRELNRIVRNSDGVHYDPTGKAPGRGAYLCDKPACWRTAVERDALGRALKTRLTPEEKQQLLLIADQFMANSTPQSPDHESPSPA